MFKVGDVVVYPMHGVARIIGIQVEKIGNTDQQCYILETETQTPSKPVIKLPIERAQANGVRRIVAEAEVVKVIEILKDRDSKTSAQTWNRRHREYQEKMRSGSIYQAAEVYRDLRLLKTNKDLSHGEQRLYDQAKNLVIKELAIAQRIEEKEIEQTIAEIFRQAGVNTEDEENEDT